MTEKPRFTATASSRDNLHKPIVYPVLKSFQIEVSSYIVHSRNVATRSYRANVVEFYFKTKFLFGILCKFAVNSE